MTKLNERIANVPERIFILAQLALGLLLAAGGGYCILRFGNDGEHFNSLGLRPRWCSAAACRPLSAAVSSVRRRGCAARSSAASLRHSASTS